MGRLCESLRGPVGWAGLAAATIVAAGCTRAPDTGIAVHARIGPDGGTISSYDSILTIAILPGALNTEVDFFVEPSSIPPEVYGPAYRVDPNPQLNTPATITYRYDLPAERAALVAVDPVDYTDGSARWTLLPRIDVDDKLVKGYDTQISVFYGLLDDGPLLSDDGNADTTGGDAGPGPGPGVGPGPGPGTNADIGDMDADADNDADNDNDNDNADNDESTEDDGPTGPCADQEIFMGPYTVEPFLTLSGPGAEDIGFSADLGGFAVVAEDQVFLVDPDANVTPYSDPLLLGPTTGTTFLDDGRLLIGDFTGDTIQQVATNGMVTPLSNAAAINGPNQIVADLMGNVWITNTLGASIVRIDPETGQSTLFLLDNDAANQVNGMVVDHNRQMVFFTSYELGNVYRVGFNGGLAVVGEPVLIAELGGTPDGMAIDECGFLYVVDNANNGVMPNRLIRLFVGDDGDLYDDPEIIVDVGGFPTAGLANAQFAQGAGWEDWSTTLFITGIPGDIYTIDMQLEGAPSIASGGE